jgi:hypothetical protein
MGYEDSLSYQSYYCYLNNLLLLCTLLPPYRICRCCCHWYWFKYNLSPECCCFRIRNHRITSCGVVVIQFFRVRIVRYWCPCTVNCLCVCGCSGSCCSWYKSYFGFVGFVVASVLVNQLREVRVSVLRVCICPP